MAGAPLGNQNAAKAKLVGDCLRRAIVQEDGKRLRQGVEKLLDAYAEGEPWAHQYVRDTLDGKPAQSMTVAGDPENPLNMNLALSVGFVESASAVPE